MPKYSLSPITRHKQKVYVTKITNFGTDPVLHCFAFFSQMDLEEFNCASADAKEVIFHHPAGTCAFGAQGYNCSQATM